MNSSITSSRISRNLLWYVSFQNNFLNYVVYSDSKNNASCALMMDWASSPIFLLAVNCNKHGLTRKFLRFYLPRLSAFSVSFSWIQTNLWLFSNLTIVPNPSILIKLSFVTFKHHAPHPVFFQCGIHCYGGLRAIQTDPTVPAATPSLHSSTTSQSSTGTSTQIDKRDTGGESRKQVGHR